MTERIVRRSAGTRAAYLARIDAAVDQGPARGKLACANLAHGFAASDEPTKAGLRSSRKPNVAIVSAYNDALLNGWPAGELATFGEVAGRVGTSSDHVRTVIARHWAT